MDLDSDRGAAPPIPKLDSRTSVDLEVSLVEVAIGSGGRRATVAYFTLDSGRRANQGAEAALIGIFEAFFDAAAARRPESLYGCPGDKPGSVSR